MKSSEDKQTSRNACSSKKKPLHAAEKGTVTGMKRIRILALCAAFLFLCSGVHAENTGKTRVLVALGDSYTSGEGIEPFYGQDEPMSEKCGNPDWLAHRSEKSWPGMLTLPGVEGAMADHRGENFFFAAASAARTGNLFLLTDEEKEAGRSAEQEKKYDRDGIKGTALLAPQLSIFDELDEKGLKADYVVLTIGGNDLGFRSIIAMGALGLTESLSGETDIDKGLSYLEEQYEMKDIRGSLKRVYRDIAARAGAQATILVVGYPDPFIDETANFLISSSNAKIINEADYFFLIDLANLVDECRNEGMNICYVDVSNTFAGHGAYGEDPYINPLILTAREQDLNSRAIVSSASMHPNIKGAEAYARCVQNAIDQLEAGTDTYLFDDFTDDNN